MRVTSRRFRSWHGFRNCHRYMMCCCAVVCTPRAACCVIQAGAVVLTSADAVLWLQEKGQLCSISLRGCDLPSAVAFQLTGMLRQHPHLRSVTLLGSAQDSLGLSVLYRELKTLRELSALDIGFCGEVLFFSSLPPPPVFSFTTEKVECSNSF